MALNEQQIAAMIELDRRGKLSPERKAALDELRRRNQPQQQAAPQTQAPQIQQQVQQQAQVQPQELTLEQAQATQQLTPIAQMIQTQEARINLAAEEANASGAFDFFTGQSKMTPEIEGLQEIGSAPELNEFSVRAFKASAGLLSTGKIPELKNIIKQQLGEDVSFKEDSKGNTIAVLPSGEYLLNAPGLSGQDVIRGVSDFLAFSPAGRAKSLVGAGVGAAATEAAIEGVEQQLGGEFSPEDVAIAAGFGAGAKGIEKIAGSLIKGLKGNTTSEIIDAGRDAGIDVLTSDLFRPKTWMGRFLVDQAGKVPGGTGTARAAQQTQREEAIKRFDDFYGTASYEEIIESLGKRSDRLKKGSGKLLGTVGQQMDELGEIAIPKTIQAAQDANEVLTRTGVIRSDKAISDLDKVLKALVGEQPPSFSQLRDVRGQVEDIIKQIDPQTMSQFGSREKSVFTAISAAMKEDTRAMAKANLDPKRFQKWLKANKIYAEEATLLTKTKIKGLLDNGKTKPEVVEGMLFSQAPSEVRLLHNSLGPLGKQNARMAVVNRIFNKLEERAAGATPDTVASFIKKELPRMKILFKGKELDEIKALGKILDSTRAAQSSSVLAQTGQQAQGLAQQVGLALAPLRAATIGFTMGQMARVYESPLVRNALLRVASAPEGSKKFAAAVERAILELNTAAQAARE